MVRLVLVLGMFLLSLVAQSQNIWSGFEHLVTPVKKYVVYKAISEMNIDGKPDESSWKHAEWSEYFTDIEGESKPAPLYSTRFKMVWDDDNLYILAKLEEPHIWAYYDKMDMIVYHENDFEIFIDPDGDTHQYYEFELNAQNTLFDLFLPKPYRNGGGAVIKWNAESFKSAVGLDGTLNDPTDIDKHWYVEVAIPFSSLTTDGVFEIPEANSYWKINFSRVQWQTTIEDGKYKRKTDESGVKHLPENNWVWSPQGVINMHYPERWGLAKFTGNAVNGDKVVFCTPIEEKLNKYLWLIYYKQQEFKREHGVYSGSLSELNIPAENEMEGVSFALELTTDGNKFSAALTTKTGIRLTINQEGFYSEETK